MALFDNRATQCSNVLARNRGLGALRPPLAIDPALPQRGSGLRPAVTVMYFPNLVSIFPILDFRYAAPPVIGWYGGQTACPRESSRALLARVREQHRFVRGGLRGQDRVDVIRAIDGGQVAQTL
jgi:hypothetical protein